jgi:hypothetical protein
MQEKTRLTQVYGQNQLKKECMNFMKWIEGALLKNDERVAMRDLQKMKDSLNKRRDAVKGIEEEDRYLNEMDEKVIKYSSIIADISSGTDIKSKENSSQDTSVKQHRRASTKVQQSLEKAESAESDILPLDFEVKREGIVPVFDTHKSDKKLSGPLMSVNRSTESIITIFQEWEDLTKENESNVVASFQEQRDIMSKFPIYWSLYCSVQLNSREFKVQKNYMI